MKYYLAVDIGATSGRHILAHIENGKIVTEEVYRFRTHSTQKKGAWVWECEALAENVIKGMKECKKIGKTPSVMGVSTWGADFVLLDKEKSVLGDAADYRDEMALVNMLFASDQIMSQEDYFGRTGIGRMPFDTLYQFMYLQRQYPGVLEQAGTLLMVPDFINYRLTGIIAPEYTNAVTTGMINADTQTWDEETISAMNFPREIFQDLHSPGKILGKLSDEVKEKVGFDCSVALVASHDTTSAFFAVPSSDPDSVTVSSGTWSILGIVNDKPFRTPLTMESGFTNEGAYPKRFRLSKNLVGMFVLERLKAELCPDADYNTVCQMGKNAGEISSVIDLTNLMYMVAENMAEAIKKECSETGQQIPKTDGEVFQVFFHSLATHYRRTVEDLERISGKAFTSLNIIGGGSRNDYVNQLAADELGITVYAGPPEATVLGNIICQLIIDGEIKDSDQAAEICAASFDIKRYEGGIQDIEKIPFQEYARRLRKEKIKQCQGMAFRTSAGFALANKKESKIFEKDDFAKAEPLYYEIFTARPDINAIIHCSPNYCAKAAKAGKTVPPVLDDMAQIIGTHLPVCAQSDIKGIARKIKKGNACLISQGEASGIIAVGHTLEQALAAILIGEKSVQAWEEGALIGGAKPIGRLTACIMHLVYTKSYSKKNKLTPILDQSELPYEISDKEMELRKEIVKCGLRLREANLVQGTWGNISVRLDDRYMLVTPSGLDYERLSPYEIVRVELATLKYEGRIRPTSEKSIHAGVLLEFSDAQCVIHSHPVNSSVFAAAETSLPVLEEEDKALLGDTVYCCDYGISGSRKLRKAVIDVMNRGYPGGILRHHGMIVRGTSIDDAFNKCNAMERAARRYLDKCKAEQPTEVKTLNSYETEVDSPVGRVTVRLTIDRAKTPIEGEFTAMKNTTPLSNVVMTEDGFKANTMFKTAFLKLPVELTCRFEGEDICGTADTTMGGLEFVAKSCD